MKEDAINQNDGDIRDSEPQEEKKGLNEDLIFSNHQH